MFEGLNLIPPEMGGMKEYLLLMLIMKLLEKNHEPENEPPLMFGRRSSTPAAPMGLSSMGGMNE